MEMIDDVLVALRRIIRATDLHSRYLAKTTGLTAPQLLLMQAVRAGDKVTIGQLANEINLSQATVTNILDRLEGRELVYRERADDDKRKVRVHLTDNGSAVIAAAPIPLQQQFVSQFDSLQDWEKSMILCSLQRVARMMDAGDFDASPVLDIGELDRQGSENSPVDRLKVVQAAGPASS